MSSLHFKLILIVLMLLSAPCFGQITIVVDPDAAQMRARTRELLFNAIPAIATERHCRCHEGLAQGPVDSL